MLFSRKHLRASIFFFWMTCSVQARSADTLTFSHQSVRSVGFAFPALNYSLLSPLNHSGYAVAFHSVRFREKPEYLNQIQLHSEFGLLYNEANESYITSLSFRGDWLRHWNVTDKTHALRLLCGFSAGAGIDVYLKEDNTNNPLAYFFNLSASPSVAGKYRFRAGKTILELGQQIDVPMISLASSSGYSSSVPPGLTEEDAGFFDAMRLVSFGSFRKCVGTTTLDIIPSPGRRRNLPALRVSYLFSGVNYKNNDMIIKSVDHLFMFGAIFRLFR